MHPFLHIVLTPATVIAFVAGALFASVAIYIGAAAERLRSRRPAAPASSPRRVDWDYIRPARDSARRVRTGARRQSIPVVETKPAREADSRDKFTDEQVERDDVRDWLIGMGYSARAASKAARAARAADPDAGIDQQIRAALKMLPADN